MDFKEKEHSELDSHSEEKESAHDKAKAQDNKSMV